jgi:hypothetical protein
MAETVINWLIKIFLWLTKYINTRRTTCPLTIQIKHTNAIHIQIFELVSHTEKNTIPLIF